MTVDPKKPRPDYYDFTYDMFMTSISGEESEISRFSKWIDAAKADGVYTFGMDGSAISFPAVPMGEARLRLFTTSEHSEEHIRRGADIVIRASQEFGFAGNPAV